MAPARLLDILTREITRQITGQLLTNQQVRAITSHTVGRYFAEFFSEPEEERRARERVEEAREHIATASSIISEMKMDLDRQTTHLDDLLTQVEEKKKLAERYEQLASTNQEKFSSYRQEMEEMLRQELVSQSEKGKKLRRTVSFAIWAFTLVSGAALGAYFKEIMLWATSTIA